MLNEKVFVFIWFWCLFLALLSTANLISWLRYCFLTTGCAEAKIMASLVGLGRLNYILNPYFLILDNYLKPI